MILWVPSLRLGVSVMVPPLHTPVGVSGVPLLYMVTVLPVTQLKVKLGVTSVVTLSLDELPVSLAVMRSGVAGAASGVTSMVKLGMFKMFETFVAASVTRMVQVL